MNNYQSYISDHSNRTNLIYAGANDGMLHAFNAETGEEEWGFIPPFVAGKLPTIVNKELDGKIDTKSGGTNAIFGVDGSPVVHDVFMAGLNKSGDIESTPSWHTILFVPYGRGGAGFSVLDVTYPVVEPGQGPIHMFSVLNDAINKRVLIADRDGTISEHAYIRGGVNISESEEAQKASQNNYTAESTDGIDSGVYTEQDKTDGLVPEDRVVGDVKTVSSKVKSIGYSVVYMKAIKALQEAQTRIETLEAKVAVLEG